MAIVVNSYTTFKDLQEARLAGKRLQAKAIKCGGNYTSTAKFEAAPEFVTVHRQMLMDMQAELMALREKLAVAA